MSPFETRIPNHKSICAAVAVAGHVVGQLVLLFHEAPAVLVYKSFNAWNSTLSGTKLDWARAATPASDRQTIMTQRKMFFIGQVFIACDLWSLKRISDLLIVLND